MYSDNIQSCSFHVLIVKQFCLYSAFLFFRYVSVNACSTPLVEMSTLLVVARRRLGSIPETLTDIRFETALLYKYLQ